MANHIPPSASPPPPLSRGRCLNAWTATPPAPSPKAGETPRRETKTQEPHIEAASSFILPALTAQAARPRRSYTTTHALPLVFIPQCITFVSLIIKITHT